MASARTFDLKIVVSDGPEITFSSINKEEHEIVETFLKSKKLRVKNEISDDMLTGGVALQLDDDDSDVDMESASDSDAGKGKSKMKAKASGMPQGGDVDSDEEGARTFFCRRCRASDFRSLRLP